MKRKAFWGFWVCTLLLLSGLSVRLLWLALPTETGLQTLRLQLRSMTVGWILGEAEPVYAREPAMQAEFWLGEVDRVLAANPNDARLAMGAALVLDSPGAGFRGKYLKRFEYFPEWGAFPEFNQQGMKRAEEAFEYRCRRKCLELAARAVELDPTNVQWRRLRALLLYPESLHSADRTPRDPNWVNILEECRRHDPDNALYDYLAAYFHWQAAATMDFSEGKERLEIKDADTFTEGIVRFEQGQVGKSLSIGDAGFTAVAELLRHTRVPLAQQEQIVNSRGIYLRRSGLLRQLWRWQDCRAVQKASAGEGTAALALERQNLHLIAQCMQGSAGAAYDLVLISSKVGTTWRMKELAGLYKSSLAPEEMEQIAELQRAAMLERKVVEEAGRKLNEGKALPRQGEITPGSATAAYYMVFGFALSLVAPLLLLGLVATILSRRSANGDGPVLGPLGQVLAVVIALSVTVTLFGLAPAEIISREVQAELFTACLALVPVVVALWIAWRWMRPRVFRFNLYTVLRGVLVVSLLFLSVAVVRAVVLDRSPVPFSMPVRTRGGWSANALGTSLTREYGAWYWAAYQWGAYDGQYLTLLFWAGLVVAFHGLKVKRARRRNVAGSADLQKGAGGLFPSLARPALVMSALVVIAYLGMAPRIVQTVEEEFQEKMSFARHPESYWQKVEKVVAEVRADEQLMGWLRDAVQKEMSESALSDSKREGLQEP